MTHALATTPTIPPDDLSPPDHSPPGPPAAVEVLAWQDDPGSGLQPVERPVPVLSDRPLPLTIETDSKVPPAAEYRVQSRAFRYWTAAEALRRAADFWGSLVPVGTRWWIGPTLPVFLDAGVDLNANYNRYGLNFYHERVAADTVYSGESPDVVCHELGHAVLDAVKPELFHTASLEVAAFHEAFGDVSAILSALQLESVRRAIIDETAGRYHSSQVSRLAEQLGAAVRRLHPDAADRDCLRNAVNSFVYKPPQSLPPWGPASTLSCEPHSFARVFTAGFFEAICLMASAGRDVLTESRLREITAHAGRLLLDGIRASQLPARLFADVAAHMVQHAGAINPSYAPLIHTAFLRRHILTPSRLSEMRDQITGVTLVRIPGYRFGLGERELVVQASGDSSETRQFVRWLIARGRIEAPPWSLPALPTHPHTVKTHRLVDQSGPIVLERILFDCGFHADS